MDTVQVAHKHLSQDSFIIESGALKLHYTFPLNNFLLLNLSTNNPICNKKRKKSSLVIYEIDLFVFPRGEKGRKHEKCFSHKDFHIFNKKRIKNWKKMASISAWHKGIHSNPTRQVHLNYTYTVLLKRVREKISWQLKSAHEEQNDCGCAEKL